MDISAFNLAQHLAIEGKIESANIPESIEPLVKKNPSHLILKLYDWYE